LPVTKPDLHKESRTVAPMTQTNRMATLAVTCLVLLLPAAWGAGKLGLNPQEKKDLVEFLKSL